MGGRIQPPSGPLPRVLRSLRVFLPRISRLFLLAFLSASRRILVVMIPSFVALLIEVRREDVRA